MKLPNNLAKHRKRAMMSQQEMAAALNIGRSRLALWESGHTLPDWAEVETMAMVLEVEPARLYPRQIMVVIKKYGGKGRSCA